MENLSRDDVVQVGEGMNFCDGTTFTVGEAIAILTSRIDDDLIDWGKSGVECRKLDARSGGWKKGKIKISLEFVPEDSSP
ncbi:MAG: hypothetical protein HC903_27765 [Methylacidiphilales bacterium]|nr:hypothetical protein [Candidatus Methylacidiphilales bacterium]NJR19977.1 hypothetical protein [Calothrix sp. CSU_2_0]